MNQRGKTDSSEQELFIELERLAFADPPAAVDRALEVLPTIDLDHPVEERLRVRRMLAMAYAHMSQFERALEICSQAISLDVSDEAPVELARVRLASMQPLAHLGQIDDAVRAGQVALQELEAVNNRSLAGRAALNLGSIHAMTGHHQEALHLFDRSLVHLSDERMLAGQIETNRGTSLAALDQFEKAEAAFSRARELLRDELPWAAAVVEGNLADLAARQGAINRSLRHFEASRRHLEREEAHGDLGRLEAEEATVLSMAGLTSLASDGFVQAIDKLTEHGTVGDLVSAKIGYGRVLVEINKLDEAEAILKSIDNEINPDEFPELHQQYLMLSTRIAIGNGYFKEASAFINDGMERVEDRPVQRLGWSLLRAHVARSLGNDVEASSILSLALEDAQKYGVTPLIANISEILSDIARDREDTDQGDEHARRAIESYEAIRGTIQANQLRQIWHHRRLGVYGEHAASLIARDNATAQHEAFGIVERIRSRTLLDTMRHGTVDVDIDDERAESADEQPLLDELNQHRRWLNWTYSSIARGDELTPQQVEELANREHAASRLADRLAMLRPQVGFTNPITLDAAQKQLDTETVILSYLVIDDQVTLQLIGSDFIHGFTGLTTRAELSGLVSAMQFQVGRALVSGTTQVSPRRAARLRRDMDDTLEQLYNVLVLPVKPLLASVSRCLVIPSGDLHSVPFAALRHDGTYLGDQVALTTAPSVSVLAGMRQDGHSHTFTPQRPLIVGVSDEVAPGLDDEARALAGVYPEATVLLGETAKKATVTAAMANADLVHLACHGRFDPAFPAASGLRLSDGWLTLDDMQQLRMDHPLVVLSGCETGRARVDRGDDLVGLITTLVISGAGRLVTSLWKTHDAAAMELIDSFYTALRQGEDLAKALSLSQQQVRETFDHPAMWAPFVGMGTRNKRVLA